MKKSLCLLLAECLLILPVSARASGVLYGDVNGDGSINAKDATLILRYSVGKLADLSKLDMAAANVNADDRVNAKDATLILRYSVKKLDKFPADNHEHSYDAVVTAPTCTEDGYTTYTCVCGDSYTETVEASGHSYMTETVAPTTEAEGYDLHTCTACGDNYKDNYTDKLPAETGCTEHSWGDWTSDANGSYGCCTSCGESITVDGSGSNYSDEAANLINEFRASQGLPALTVVNDPYVLIRAQELTIKVQHNRLNGKDNSLYSDWYGENVGAGYGSAKAFVNACATATDGHKETMLRTAWSKVCVAYNGDRWIMMFGADIESEECTAHSWGNWTSDDYGSYGSCTNCGESITIDGTGSNLSKEVVDIINEYRAAEGLDPVTGFSWNFMRVRAHELTVSFSHSRPDGSDGYDTCIAAGYGSPQEVVDAWMGSSSHRGSLMSPYATEASAAYNGVFWVLYIG